MTAAAHRNSRTLGPRLIILALLLIGFLAVFAMLGGCGPSLDGQRARISNTAANQATFTTDDQAWNSQVHGVTPSFVSTDAQGMDKQSGGLSRTMTLSFNEAGEVVLNVDDPLDGSLEGLDASIAPDGTFRVTLDAFASAPSLTNASLDLQVVTSLEQAGVIAAEQAAVARQAIEAGVPLGQALIQALAGGF